jgi:peptidyl-prolyl cis-trans isomerase B (cyclophilin B)
VPPRQGPTDKRTGTLPDKSTAAGKTFIATVTTNCGVITMELDGTKAPQTVASFLGLAKSGYWADSPCHRLTTSGIFVLQCGDPTGTGRWHPGYGYGVENPPGRLPLPRARWRWRARRPQEQWWPVLHRLQGPGWRTPSATRSFGKVTSGMGIVDKIAAAGASPVGRHTAPCSHQHPHGDVTEKKA